uniref:Uncharacterized protein n=1 Tax=Sporolithon durum TaxID=48970 RepID=V9P5D0_9FLOR|nr:hypothetical protein Spor.duru.mt.34 [Sporolithon durum]AGU16694.1 hypothetical protein Spor.duru.mt.34 [Sporolithon durum]
MVINNMRFRLYHKYVGVYDICDKAFYLENNLNNCYLKISFTNSSLSSTVSKHFSQLLYFESFCNQRSVIKKNNFFSTIRKNNFFLILDTLLYSTFLKFFKLYVRNHNFVQLNDYSSISPSTTFFNHEFLLSNILYNSASNPFTVFYFYFNTNTKSEQIRLLRYCFIS